jgi:hypothetical protein
MSNPSIVEKQLETAVVQLERAAETQHFNTLCISHTGGVCRLLGREDLARRAELLLQQAARQRLFVLPLASLEELEKRHAIYSPDVTLQYIRQNAVSEHTVEVCLNGLLVADEARDLSGYELEMAANTFAVLGKLEAAAFLARQETDPARTLGMLSVLAIESWRCHQIENAEALVDEIDVKLSGPDPWMRSILALGLSGREPWAGYPYPDY